MGSRKEHSRRKSKWKDSELQSHMFSRNSKVRSLVKGSSKEVRLWEARVQTV